jgi:hypothetical protein
VDSIWVDDNLPEHPAIVKVSGGITTPTEREFEFIRFDVGAEVPCHPKDMDACFDNAKAWVVQRIKDSKDELL